MINKYSLPSITHSLGGLQGSEIVSGALTFEFDCFIKGGIYTLKEKGKLNLGWLKVDFVVYPCLFISENALIDLKGLASKRVAKHWNTYTNQQKRNSIAAFESSILGLAIPMPL